MIIPFDIKHRQRIESGEYKVRTASGKPARVVCWDYKSQFNNETIYVLITTSDGYEYGCPYTEDGRYIGNNENYLVIDDGRQDAVLRWEDRVLDILKSTCDMSVLAEELLKAAIHEENNRMIEASGKGVVIEGTNGQARDDGQEKKVYFDR